jgi:hypothetical protein
VIDVTGEIDCCSDIKHLYSERATKNEKLSQHF